MDDAVIAALAQDALVTSLLLSAPILIVSLAIGLVISILQAMTQVNEVTLTFVPKILGVFAVAGFFGPWMVNTMVEYTHNLFISLPFVIQ